MKDVYFNLLACAVVGVIFSFFVGVFYRVKNTNLKTKINWWTYVFVVLWCFSGFVYFVESWFWSFFAMLIVILTVHFSHRNGKKLEWLTNCWINL